MAPQRPSSREQRGSAPPSPTKGSPRKSGDKRRSTGDAAARKRASRDSAAAAGAADDSPTKKDRDGEGERERRRRSSSSPTKAVPASPRKSGHAAKKSSPSKARPRVAAAAVVDSDPPTSSGSLSAESLAKLDAQNNRDSEKKRKQAAKDKVTSGRVGKDKLGKSKGNKKRGAAAGAAAGAGAGLTEKNLAHAGGGATYRRRNRVRAAAESVLSGDIVRPRGGGKGHMDRPANTSRRRKFICFGILGVLVLLAILIPVGVVVVGKHNNGGGGGGGGDGSGGPDNSNLGGINPDSIPKSAKGGYLDPFSWYDTEDFNLTYTDATVGGLPIMGLNSSWDDSVRANDNVPPLDQPFGYGKTPIRGVNLGGWLAIEPFITPSLFNSYGSKDNVVDEYTLCQQLGPTTAAQTIEKHYSSFINREAFAEVRDAGFDHVRIPYSYWAVTTYPGDPYVPKIAWRYLLRGIEYARQNGLRVKLDFHGLPGSQNGWNHSGRQGVIGWLNGTDGDLNGQRSLDLHKQLATFFSQPRYANVIGIYGLVNEPKMISLPLNTVLNWTTNAIDIVRGAGLNQTIAIGDGFLGLPKWQGQLSNEQDIVLDAHQYVIFNTDQIAFDHKTKLNFACSGWAGQMKMSTDPSTGFGPTMCGEWSQADTDCTQYINNVNVGSRWTGTMNMDNPSLDVLTPSCPLKSSQCSCDSANADPSSYSATYKQWLLMNAEAQMNSFEIGYGWFYWTWLTESATQWSWKLGMQAGIVPQKVWDRDFKCNSTVPDFGSMGLSESY